MALLGTLPALAGASLFEIRSRIATDDQIQSNPRRHREPRPEHRHRPGLYAGGGEGHGLESTFLRFHVMALRLPS